MSILSETVISGDYLSNTLLGTGDDALVKGSAGDDTVKGGNGCDDVNGGSGNDLVKGGFGDDNVKGGQGDDTINGGKDNDTMAGGQGEDIFVYDGAWGNEAGDDCILDFTNGDDMIDLRNSEIIGYEMGEDGVILVLANGGHASEGGAGFGSLYLKGVSLEDLDSSDFVGGSDYDFQNGYQYLELA